MSCRYQFPGFHNRLALCKVMMLLKLLHSICQQIWKTQQWKKDWKSQFSFQFPRKAMPKYVQTTAQLHLFHMLARKFSKSFKLGFKSTWTENFQMDNLNLDKVEEPEIKLPTSTGTLKKAREFHKKKKNLLLLRWLQ